jgi:hypothetical protein
VANVEKAIAEAVLAASGLSASKLGLRFDRVVGRVLGDLRTFADDAAPEGVTVVVTIAAPIRTPAKTIEALRRTIDALLSADAPSGDRSAGVHGNDVRIRLVRREMNRGLKLIGFVHNPGSATDQLLDLAERWVRR